MVLRPSELDPWSEVELVRVPGAVHQKCNNSMLLGQVVAEADPVAFALHSRLKQTEGGPLVTETALGAADPPR